MKFTCTQENLLQGLNKVVPIAGRNSQLPILQHVLLQNKNGALHLMATDLEVGIHARVGGKGEKAGSCTVPARNLHEYVQQLPSTNPIILEKKGTSLSVSTQDFYAQFLTSNPDDFPLLPSGKEEHVIEIEAPLLSQALSRTAFAAAKDDTRPEIHSVYIYTKDEKLCVVATDSFRLAEEIVRLPESVSFSILTPLSTAQEITRLFGGQKSIHISPSHNYLSVKGGGIELTSRLVSGDYPDYQQIIPKNKKTIVRVPCAEFLRALKTLVVFLPRESRRVQLTIRPKKGEVTAHVVGSDTGQGDVRFSVTGEGENIDIMLNIQYLIEGIQHIPSEECSVSLIDPEDPVVIRPVEKDIQYTYVVMPIQSS